MFTLFSENTQFNEYAVNKKIPIIEMQWQAHNTEKQKACTNNLQ